MQEPYTVSIHYETGDPSGVRLIRRDHWDGRAIAFARDQWLQVKSSEDTFKTGVYLLLGYGNDPLLPNVYIGQSDNIPRRFAAHLAQRRDWQLAVIFGSSDGSLNAAHIKWLEHELIARAKDRKSVV